MGSGDIWMKLAKNGMLHRFARLAKRTRAGAGWSGGHGFESRLIFGFFFLPLLKLSKLFWQASLPVLEALNVIHSQILYDHLYSYLRSIISLL